MSGFGGFGAQLLFMALWVGWSKSFKIGIKGQHLDGMMESKGGPSNVLKVILMF